jgi:hypothetical protein
MNTLLLLGTVLGVGGLMIAAAVCVIARAPAKAALAAGAAAAWALGYGVLLVLSSLLSHEQVLVPGDIKYFCGFFLDCHIGVAIAGTRTAGTDYVVSLGFTSSARRATLSPYDVQVALIGSDGRTYDQPSIAAALERQIAPGGGYVVDVRFSLPEGVRPTRLLVSEGVGIDRIIDGLVIGNENSFLHKRTYLAI